MTYALQLWPHANIRYMASLQKLAMNELVCLLESVDIHEQPYMETLGGAHFLLFNSPELPDTVLKRLYSHSSIYMLCKKEHDLLRPLTPKAPWVFPGDIAEILKYKGKTNASFTMLMVNCALAASRFKNDSSPLTILDPLCGKGTTLFCALRRGDHAVGIDTDKKDLKECSDYFSKYLQFNHIKHKCVHSSLTLPKGRNASKTAFNFYLENFASEQTLSLIQGDTTDTAHLLRPQSVNLIVADLPYGVQHAPDGRARHSGLLALIDNALAGWKSALKSGGAIALSFNAYTLKKKDLISLLDAAGLTVMTQAPYDDFEHYVEQAVNRDLVVAVK